MIARLMAGTPLASEAKFYPQIAGLPDLPAVEWSAIGATAPILAAAGTGSLPQADVVVITWADAEWAAMEHVFVRSSVAMPYSSAGTSAWDGWQKYDSGLPASAPSDWTFWGYYRLVETGSQRVLLFKSNTHLDWPGQTILAQLVTVICQQASPSLILSIGTAGGCRVTDNLGAVNVVNAGTLYQAGQPQSDWPVYSTSFTPGWNIISQTAFSSLLFPVPATASNLQELATQFNGFYGTSYSLDQLNAGGLDLPTALPVLSDLTPGGTSLLTTSTFVVGTTAGDYNSYAVIEMDDAVLAEVCQQHQVLFGAVRNVSDPAQNPALPATAQGGWGSAVYDVFGFYTSYNGAVAAWAIIAAGAS